MAWGIIDQTAVRAEFSDLAAGQFTRSTPQAITICKSVGAALADLIFRRNAGHRLTDQIRLNCHANDHVAQKLRSISGLLATVKRGLELWREARRPLLQLIDVRHLLRVSL
jgi:hypothetical protein